LVLCSLTFAEGLRPRRKGFGRRPRPSKGWICSHDSRIVWQEGGRAGTGKARIRGNYGPLPPNPPLPTLRLRTGQALGEGGTLLPSPRVGGGAGGGGCVELHSQSKGKAKLAVVPDSPSPVPLALEVLSSQMWPPWASTSALAMERPRPLPPRSRERERSAR